MKQAEKNSSTSTFPPVVDEQKSFFPSQEMAPSIPFFGPATIQPKLEIGSPNDKYEQEADAMAEKVTQQTATPTLTAPAGVQRKCAHCEEEEKLRRKESGDAVPAIGPAFTNELTNSTGSGFQLQPGIRSTMESAFGYDFSPVRLHTDSQAVQLSKNINAQAFTYGNDIYFNTSIYNTDSTAGQKLLAHELTHVVQQGAGVQRKKIQRETNVTVANVPGACSLDQHHQIAPAIQQASTWLHASINRLDTFIGAPTREPGVLAALERHFHSSTPETAGRVRRMLGRIDSEILTRPDLRVECHTPTDTSCNAAGAYVTGNLFVFCPDFFNGSANWQATSIIHEMAHTLTGVTHITDRAYRSDRVYQRLSTIEALTNAASYENFCLELGSGTPIQSTAPQDETNDCSERQATPVRRSMAQLERWNRNAQGITSDQRPGMLSQWQDLQTQHLGGTTAADIRRARRAYDQVYGELSSALTFECERSCDRNVTGYYRYFLFITNDTLHLCPMLFSLNEDDRTLEIYRLILMRYGDVSPTASVQLASLAKSLNDRFWTVPTALTGFD